MAESKQTALSLAELERYDSGVRSGGVMRYYCPIHGGDHQRSLELNVETGRFFCYNCQAWGYLEEYRQKFVGSKRSEKQSGNICGKIITPAARPELIGPLKEYQESLKGSLGESYLRSRGISFELARAYGTGYAAPGKWLGRSWKYGRLVFPHTNPQGDVVNLYGRAVGEESKLRPEELKDFRAKKHDHLSGAKGAFNAAALKAGTVLVTEGAFDALSAIAAGFKNTCAIYGVNGLRWDWLRAKRLILGFDRDGAGSKELERLSDMAIMAGFEVAFLTDDTFGGCKDLNEVWVKTGKIDVGEWMPAAKVEIPEMKEPPDFFPDTTKESENAEAVVVKPDSAAEISVLVRHKGKLLVKQAPYDICFDCGGFNLETGNQGEIICRTCNPIR